MGMSIDEALKEIDKQIICLTDAGNISKEVLALEKLVDIAHKYQQIEQILDDCDLEAWEVLEMIKEVVADGDDC